MEINESKSHTFPQDAVFIQRVDLSLSAFF